MTVQLEEILIGGDDDEEARMGRELGAPMTPVAPQAPTQRPALALGSPQQTPSLGRGLGSPSGEAPPAGMRQRVLSAIAKGGQKPQQAQPDYTGVDVADGFRRVLHALGSGLRSASGNAPTPFRSLGEEARERDARAAQLAERRAQQGTAQRGAQERLGIERERLGLQRETAEQMREMRTRQADARDLETQSRIRSNESLATERGSRATQRELQMSELREQMQRREALRQPASPETVQLREEVRSRIRSINGLEPQLQRSGVLQWLDTASGEAIERFASQHGIETRARPLLARRGGPGGGGNPQTEETLNTPPAGWQGTPEGWRALSRRQRQAQIAELGTPTRGRGPTPNTRDLAVRVSAADDALRELEESIPADGQDVPGFGRVDSLLGRSIVQSDAGVRLRTQAENAVRRYLRLESGATIGEDEMAAEMSLRGMGPGASERQMRDGVRDLRRDLDARARTLTEGLQAPGEGNQTPARQRPTQSGGAHRYELPDGRRVTGPAGGLEALRARYGDGVSDLGPVGGGE